MQSDASQAGDTVEIVTPDDVEDAPTEKWGFPITTIKGFRFALYSEICLTFDLRRISLDIMRRFKPDLLHVTSPGFIVFIGIIIARILKVPLVFSYHTHLPVYAKMYMGKVPGIEKAAWRTLRYVHNRADLTLVRPSPT